MLYEMCALRPPFQANSMQQLYQKIQRGVFERIPARYSDELHQVISSLIKLSAKDRPSCDQILGNPVVQRHGNHDASDKSASKQSSSSKKELLQTIRCPKNLLMLKDKLPKANYKKKKSYEDTDIKQIREVPEDSAHPEQQDSSFKKKRQRVMSAGYKRPPAPDYPIQQIDVIASKN